MSPDKGISWTINQFEKAPAALCGRTSAVGAWNSAGFAANQVSQRVTQVERLPRSVRTPFTAERQNTDETAEYESLGGLLGLKRPPPGLLRRPLR